MTAAELIKDLQAVPPDTQIRVWADHGQSCMIAHTACMQAILKDDIDENMDDTINIDDEGKIEEGEDDELTSDDLVYIFEIGAP